MLYKKEIDNPVLIQFILLFVLGKMQKPISQTDLSTLVLENCNITFVNYQLAVANLVDTKHVETFTVPEHGAMYEITEKGRRADHDFYKEIPIYIREPIEASIKPLFRKKQEAESVRAKLMPLNEKEFMAECGLYDNGKPLFTFSLYAGDRDHAVKLIEQFKQNPESVYRSVLEALNPEMKE
jgi:predicted transcriptional regulator